MIGYYLPMQIAGQRPTNGFHKCLIDLQSRRKLYLAILLMPKPPACLTHSFALNLFLPVFNLSEWHFWVNLIWEWGATYLTARKYFLALKVLILIWVLPVEMMIYL